MMNRYTKTDKTSYVLDRSEYTFCVYFHVENDIQAIIQKGNKYNSSMCIHIVK